MATLISCLVGTCENVRQSFNLSKFPNLQEVKFDLRVGGRGAGTLPWIPSALSTLKPATSPRLATIRLDFAGPPIASLHVESLIKDMGGDLRRIADEADRIEREFEGAVEITVLRDPVFGEVLDTLNVSCRSRGR